MTLPVTPREVSILIGDKEYHLSPTFSAILDIEQRSGRGLNAILQTILTRSVSFTDLVTIVWAGIRANYRVEKKSLKDVPEWDTLAEQIQLSGYGNILETLTQFLTLVVNGTQTIQGDSEEDSEKNG